MDSKLFRSEAFVRDDIRNILRAIQVANSSMGRFINQDDLTAYQAGFESAILAIATAFDLDMATEARPATLGEPQPFRVLHESPGSNPMLATEPLPQDFGSSSLSRR